MIGPPGIVTINTKHHRTGKLVLDGDQLTLNGRGTDYVRKARREAERADQLVRAAVAGVDPATAERIRVRPMIVVVGGRVVVREWSPGVSVVMTDRLLPTLQAFSAALDSGQVATVLDVARHPATWNPPVG